MSSIDGRQADPQRIRLAVERNDFALASGRQPGAEDRGDEMRKGIVGDWRNAFSRESAQVFEAKAGRELRLLGYEQDAAWVDSLPC